MTEPIHIISLGAGVQSSTMSLMAACGEITPMPKCAIFADTQAEPASVYRWLDWLEKQLPFPVIRATAGDLSKECIRIMKKRDASSTYAKILIPAYLRGIGNHGDGILPRFCTRDFKIYVVRREALKLMRQERAISVIQWIGISWDEALRMKPSQHRKIENRWPLIENKITRQKCLAWMSGRGHPKPPRSACVYCPFHSDAEWRNLKSNEPEEFSKAVDFELALQSAQSQSTKITGMPFLHRSLVPLSEVDFSTEEERGQLSLFNNECEGMCGV